MSYQETQWKALESINNNQLKHLDNLDELYLIFLEIGKVEKAYSDGLALVEKKIKCLNDYGTLGKVFNLLIKNIKMKKEQHLILERIIRTIFNQEQLIILQNDQFRNQINSHKEHNDFHEMTKSIENSKNEYHACLQNIEKAFLEELIKVTNSQIEPEVFEKKKAEFIEMEKKAKIDYCERINEGNMIRDNYENQVNKLLKGIQKTHESYLLTCSNNISTYFVNEREIYKKMSESASEIKEICDEINVENEIEQYCKRNNRHGKPPASFNFDVYLPTFSYFPIQQNDKNNKNELLKKRSHRTILKDFFNKNFGYFPPEGIYDQTIVDNYKILEAFVADIWQDKCNTHLLQKIDFILEESKMRYYFLKMMNQSRLKLSSLSEKSFKILVHLMKIILNESIKYQPYCFDAIHLIVILSQTFYMIKTDPDQEGNDKAKDNNKGQDNQVFLQSEIMKEKLWQNKAIWEGLIIHNFETEMNNDINLQSLSLEDKIIKEQSTIIIILTTFNFIMTTFGYDAKGVHEVIATFCSKFNIGEEKIKSIE